MYTRIMQGTTLLLLAAAAGAAAQQPVTMNVPGTPAHAPTTLTGCLMPGGGTTSMPGSGGSSGTGPAGMNTDAANSGVFFTDNRAKKRPKETAYSLVGVDAAALHRYANQRVAVEGVLLPPVQPGATRPDSSATVSTGKTASDKAPAQFRVTAIKQIPGSCGGR
jgi:hypothetical protein